MDIIRVFQDGTEIGCDQGKFDKWCIYVKRPGGDFTAPRDVEYFHDLLTLSTSHGPDKVYADFVTVYNLTGRYFDDWAMDKIRDASEKYGENGLLFDVTMSVLHCTMVSEENKRSTRLGKKIKRLGVHQVLHGILSPEDAAIFSKGKGWQLLSDECRKYGF